MLATTIGAMIHANDTQIGSSYTLLRQNALRLASGVLRDDLDCAAIRILPQRERQSRSTAAPVDASVCECDSGCRLSRHGTSGVLGHRR